MWAEGRDRDGPVGYVSPTAPSIRPVIQLPWLQWLGGSPQAGWTEKAKGHWQVMPWFKYLM